MGTPCKSLESATGDTVELHCCTYRSLLYCYTVIPDTYRSSKCVKFVPFPLKSSSNLQSRQNIFVFLEAPCRPASHFSSLTTSNILQFSSCWVRSLQMARIAVAIHHPLAPGLDPRIFPVKIGTHLPMLLEVWGLSLCSKRRHLESWATDATGATWAQWYLFILHRSRRGNGIVGLLKGKGDKIAVDGQNLANASCVWNFIAWSAAFHTSHVVQDGVHQTSTVPY